MKAGPYVGKAEAANYAGQCVRTLDYARERGDLPYYRVGRKVLFRVADLDAWMDRFRVDVARVGGAA